MPALPASWVRRLSLSLKAGGSALVALPELHQHREARKQSHDLSTSARIDGQR